jgi:hypothetical protein
VRARENERERERERERSGVVIRRTIAFKRKRRWLLHEQGHKINKWKEEEEEEHKKRF